MSRASSLAGEGEEAPLLPLIRPFPALLRSPFSPNELGELTEGPDPHSAASAVPGVLLAETPNEDCSVPGCDLLCSMTRSCGFIKAPERWQGSRRPKSYSAQPLSLKFSTGGAGGAPQSRDARGLGSGRLCIRIRAAPQGALRGGGGGGCKTSCSGWVTPSRMTSKRPLGWIFDHKTTVILKG